jgi:hypothetical protein
LNVVRKECHRGVVSTSRIASRNGQRRFYNLRIFLLRISSFKAVFVPAIRFSFSNISFRYRGSKTKTISRLEPKTIRLQTAEKRNRALPVIRFRSMLRSFGSREGYGGILCRRGEPATASPNSCLQPSASFSGTFWPSAVVAHFAKPSFASIVLPPIVWHHGRRRFFRGIGPRLKHNTFGERLPFRGFESSEAGTRRIGAKPNVN